MKKCFKCNIDKPITEYYKHPKTRDSLLGKCKSCTKKDSIDDYNKNIQDEGWVLKEVERNKERRSRLNYTEKHKTVWCISRPWMNTTTYKNLRNKHYSNLKKNYKLHHWNYNDGYLEDVFIMESRQHRVLHNSLTLDIEKKVFYLKDGTYLDTKEKHENYIRQLNFYIGDINDSSIWN